MPLGEPLRVSNLQIAPKGENALGLALRNNAANDFTRSVSVATQLPYAQGYSDIPTTSGLIRIAELGIQNGIDPSPLLRRVQEHATTLESPHGRHDVYVALARMHARNNNLPEAETALATAESYGDYGHPYAHFDIARAYAASARDLKPALEKAYDLTGRLDIGGERDREIIFQNRTKISHLTDFAVLYAELGLNPKPLLLEAEALIESLNPHDASVAYRHLSKGYTAIGEFTTALTFVDKITEDTPGKTQMKKAAARSVISEKQLAIGDLDGALETARGSNDDVVIAKTYAKVAVLLAENGQNPSEAVDAAIQSMTTIENLSVQMELYSLLGRAKALANEDPTEMFTLAMERVQRLTAPHLKSDAFCQLASDLDASGYDASTVFEMALEWTDQIAIAPHDTYQMGRIGQAMAWEAIIRAQIALGYFDAAREALSRFENDSFLQLEYAELLAELANAQLKRR